MINATVENNVTPAKVDFQENFNLGYEITIMSFCLLMIISIIFILCCRDTMIDKMNNKIQWTKNILTKQMDQQSAILFTLILCTMLIYSVYGIFNSTSSISLNYRIKLLFKISTFLENIIISLSNILLSITICFIVWVIIQKIAGVGQTKIEQIPSGVQWSGEIQQSQPNIQKNVQNIGFKAFAGKGHSLMDYNQKKS